MWILEQKRLYLDPVISLLCYSSMDLPALSVEERHMIIMSNLGILVKFSKYLTAKSISSLPNKKQNKC